MSNSARTDRQARRAAPVQLRDKLQSNPPPSGADGGEFARQYIFPNVAVCGEQVALGRISEIEFCNFHCPELSADIVETAGPACEASKAIRLIRRGADPNWVFNLSCRLHAAPRKHRDHGAQLEPLCQDYCCACPALQ